MQIDIYFHLHASEARCLNEAKSKSNTMLLFKRFPAFCLSFQVLNQHGKDNDRLPGDGINNMEKKKEKC